MCSKFNANVILLMAMIWISSSVSATPEDERSGHREERKQLRQGARSDVRESQQFLPPLQQESGSPAQSLHQAGPASPVSSEPSADGGRRPGKMSPEDRRALRQQIDQTSHELNPPGR